MKIFLIAFIIGFLIVLLYCRKTEKMSTLDFDYEPAAPPPNAVGTIYRSGNDLVILANEWVIFKDNYDMNLEPIKFNLKEGSVYTNKIDSFPNKPLKIGDKSNATILTGSVILKNQKMIAGDITKNSLGVNNNTLYVENEIHVYGKIYPEKNINSNEFVIPIGIIVPWVKNNNEIPDGWALCNGQTLLLGDEKDYTELRNLIGNPNDTFVILPDLRESFIFGQHSDPILQLMLGKIGNEAIVGVKSVKLTHSNIAHNHALKQNNSLNVKTTITDGKHNHKNLQNGYGTVNSNLFDDNSDTVGGTYLTGLDGDPINLQVRNMGYHTHTFDDNTTFYGGGSRRNNDHEEFSIMPPYISLCYIIKVSN